LDLKSVYERTDWDSKRIVDERPKIDNGSLS
jgi:hypothetical protein